LDEAFGIQPPDNGRILRNLIQMANHIQSHILHFYHLAALDFVDITAILKYKGNDAGLNKVKAWAEAEAGRLGQKVPGSLAPFLPRFKGDYIPNDDINIGAIAHYLKALEMRKKAHEMLALFGGKMPHSITNMPGGVTEKVTVEKIASYLWRVKELQAFVDTVYLPDVIAVASAYTQYFGIGAGCKNFLSYGAIVTSNDGKGKMLPSGVFTDGQVSEFNPEKIAEYVKFSRYSSGSGLHPYKGETEPDARKEGAYTWVKAPRYNGKPHEVGPLARTVITYLKKGDPAVVNAVDSTLKYFKADVPALFSVLGRHAARALECSWMCTKAIDQVLKLDPAKPTHTPCPVPESGMGAGLTEASRGSLGHWIVVEKKKIARYQAVVPGTWLTGPKDDMGQRGPMEEALVGTPIADPENPIEAVRVVRSFDPCLACAIHVMTPKGDLKKFRIS
jgi:Ni,Fe-hydrogenase I large subunit